MSRERREWRFECALRSFYCWHHYDFFAFYGSFELIPSKRYFIGEVIKYLCLNSLYHHCQYSSYFFPYAMYMRTWWYPSLRSDGPSDIASHQRWRWVYLIRHLNQLSHISSHLASRLSSSQDKMHSIPLVSDHEPYIFRSEPSPLRPFLIDPFRNSPDRQSFQKRDHSSQLHLPVEGVRADGDWILHTWWRRGLGTGEIPDVTYHLCHVQAANLLLRDFLSVLLPSNSTDIDWSDPAVCLRSELNPLLFSSTTLSSTRSGSLIAGAGWWASV